MLPQHHLLSLIPNRIQAAINSLNARAWTGIQTLRVEATESGPRQLTLKEALRLPRRPVADESFWGRLFDQRWCRVVLPAYSGTIYFNWKDQGEATLYIKGKPYFGLDVAHRCCRLPAGVKELWIESNCIQSAIWHHEAEPMKKSGSFFTGAFLSRRDDDAWGGYHDLKCLFDLAMDQRTREDSRLTRGLNGFGQQPPVDKATPFYRQVLRGMDEAVDVLDRSGPAAMRKKLAGLYRELRVDKTFMKCVLTGHAHIDLVWIWPERIGELKAVHSFATANRLMEEYPEFKFAYSQPASYEAVKRRAPELYRDIAKRIREKRWEATGAMYVESDTLIACGEALARSFMLGQKGFREINGAPSKLTWLPDVFGYSACLPQLMKLTGVEYFFTTKMTWNAITKFPHSSFIWKGNDGSEVVSHVMQDANYVTHMEVNDVRAPMLGHQQSDVHREYLLPTGYGDGGGGPTAEMCERARRLGSLPGMPEVKWDQPEAFFERLGKIKNQLPVHQGECYLEFHRGTFTSHGDLKAAFRGLEKALQVAEAVESATGNRWETEKTWKRMVFAQFHDYIPGSSVWDVYQEGVPELRKLAGEQLALAQKSIEGKKGDYCVFNPHALPVLTRVRHPRTKKDVLVSLPPLSGTPLDEAVLSERPAPVTVSGNKVSNGLTSFEIGAKGWIQSLSWEGQTVPLDGPLGQLLLYPDRPSNFDAWEIDRQTLSLGEVCDEKAVIAPWKDSEFCQGLAVTRKVGQQSSATIRFTLEAGSPLVHVTVELDWNEPEHLLKLHFPTKYAATNARFGAPFGSVLRSQVSSDLASEAKWEVPFSRYLAVFDEGEMEGLFLAVEAKYGATVRDGKIGLSLVRSPRVTGFDAGHANAWPAHLSRLKVQSPCADIGKHSIRLALGFYSANLSREKQPAAVAETLFTAPLVYQGKKIAPVLESLSGGETLVPVWAMPAEGKSWVLRFHEVSGRRGTVKIRAAKGWQMEKSGIGGDAIARTSGAIGYTPYQIVSVKFTRKA